MRIAHIIKSFNRGGAEVLLREAIETNQAYSIDLIILNKKAISLLPDLPITIRVYLFNFFSLSFPFELIRLVRLLRTQRYDVLHTHLPIAGFITRLIKPFFKSFSKLIYTEHNLVTHYNLITKYLNGVTYRFNDHVIFVSEETLKSVEERRKGKCYNYQSGSVVLNGVNTEKFKSVKAPISEIIVGTVASFRKQKRLDQWIEVVRLFKTKYPYYRVKFILAGDGEERATVEALIKKHGLSDTVQTTGTIVDTVSFYNTIDIFMMTSDFEGLPVALLEAMSSSCVPIVTNVGGIKQMDFTGFGLKLDKFDAGHFCDKIAHYANDSTNLSNEGVKARRYIVEKFSINRQLEELNNIYNQSGSTKVCTKDLLSYDIR